MRPRMRCPINARSPIISSSLCREGSFGKRSRQIVQITLVDLHVALVEYFRQTVELLVRNTVLDDNDRVVQIAALDQIVVDQRLQFVQKNERAARCDLLGEILHAVEPRVLIPDDLGLKTTFTLTENSSSG